MIASAIEKVISRNTIKEATKIKAIVSDFINTLKSFAPVYQFRTAANVFALLGNTLGNIANESAFLDTIKESMFDNDIVIIEVRAQGNDELSLGGDFELNKRFDFTPLEMLGVQFDPDKLQYKIRGDLSTIPQTKTIVAYYKDFYIGSDKFDEARLSYVHTYNRDSLITVIKNKGFNILKSYEDEKSICIVMALHKNQS